jgi:hypothetical protein
MKVKMEFVLSFLAALYAVYNFPTGYLLLTGVITILAFCTTESYHAVLGALLLMIILRIITTILEPGNSREVYGAVGGPIGGTVRAVENFQPKDPISIHQRLADDKKAANPVDKIYGVLESPQILDSLQITAIDETDKGASRTTLPAYPGAYEPIRTPAEGIVPNIFSHNITPRGNPYLQNGPDAGAIDTALVKSGTKLHANSDFAGVSVGPGAAV